MLAADPFQHLYRDTVLEHARAPRHAAPLPLPCREGEARNRLCGDHVGIRLTLDHEGCIAAISHASDGCVLCVASASLMCGRVLGGDRQAVTQWHAALQPWLEGDVGSVGADLGELVALAGVAAYPSRRACVLLPWEALLQALATDASPA